MKLRDSVSVKPSPPSPAPVLTVVVVVLGGRNCLIRCLRALVDQVGVPILEIIVPCDESIDNVSTLRTEFPRVRFLSLKGHRTYAELRALGVQKARGTIVALTEDHCTPSSDWCAQILKAHASRHAAIGGAVDKVTPDTTVNWALYLADYVRYMNPASEGFTNNLTDCNVSYKRSALDAISNVWKDEFHEPAVHRALQLRGECLWFSPNIVVWQHRSVSLGNALRDRYVFGRLFGSGRMASTSNLVRALYACIALLLPPVTVGRIARNVFQKRRCTLEFFRTIPTLVLLNTVWAYGEFVGYVTGRPAASLTPGLRQSSLKQHSGQEATT